MDELGSWEFILINDGSRDGSLKEMLSIKDKRVKVVDLKRNYGQAVAMDAGFREAKGEFLISIDADLQNDPADIVGMFEKMQNEKLDVIAGWRKKRKDPLWMIIITLSARFLRGFFASDGVHDSGCTLRIYRRDYVDDIELWGEMHRYIMALLKWRGAKVGEIIVNHRVRDCGISKYNWKKSFKGLVDLIYIWFWKKFSARPLHLFGITGMFLALFGSITALWTIYLKIFQNVSLSDSVWFMMSGFLIMSGIMFFMFGMILDLMIRTYYNTSKVECRYKVKKVYDKK